MSTVSDWDNAISWLQTHKNKNSEWNINIIVTIIIIVAVIAYGVYNIFWGDKSGASKKEAIPLSLAGSFVGTIPSIPR